LAFSTIQGSGGAPDSFVGTSGVDALAFTTSVSSPYFLGAQQSDDVVAWVGTANQQVTVTDASLNGGRGNDLFTASHTVFSSVVINGNQGNDVFRFWPGPTQFLGSTLYGGQGDDSITLDAVSSSYINGNKGNDILDIGDDGVFLDAEGLEFVNTNRITTTSNSSIFGGQGNDEIFLWGNFVNTVINGDLGDDYIGGKGTLSGFTASGNDGNDSVCGGLGDDTLYGNDGNDLVAGNGGSDTLVGGLGADTLWGNYYEVEGQVGVDGANLFVYNSGDSFAATAGAGRFVTFGNGVDYIADFTIGSDAVDFNGFIYDTNVDAFDLFTSGVGFATIVDGNYRIDTASTNGLVVVLGTYNTDNQTFTGGVNVFTDDILWFASTAAIGSIIVDTDVEAIITNVINVTELA
jgi:Ca2+-binding RTX toxin-like protein